MEKFRNHGGRLRLLCSLLMTFLLLCGAHAGPSDGVIEQVTDPTGNVNLSPFQQWRSAYECLLNTSKYCPDKYKLTDAGEVNVAPADTEEYCTGGCKEHTMAVLTCIHLVKRDYKFVNGARVQDLDNTIKHGCTFGFNGSTLVSSNARNVWESKTIFLSIIPALILLAQLDGNYH